MVARLSDVFSADAPADERERSAAEVDALFASNQDRIYAVCLKLTGDPERARELAQEAMLIAYAKLPSFRGDSSFSTWLYAIARNLCYRASSKRGELLSEDGIVDEADSTSSVLSQLGRHEREELIHEASAAVLEPLEQEAVYLRYVERMSHDQISTLLDLETASGARGLLQRCRRKFKAELSRSLEELGHDLSSVRTGS